MKNSTRLFLFGVIFSLSLTSQSFCATEQDHEELRGLLTTFTEAFNEQDFDRLERHIADEFVITLIDHKRFRSWEEFSNYAVSIFEGDETTVTSVTFKPEADEPSWFLADGAVAINTGTSIDTYEFENKVVRSMETRWTMSAIKEDGQWKVAAIHMSGNIFDNPLLHTLQEWGWRIILVVGSVALLLGFFWGRYSKNVSNI